MLTTYQTARLEGRRNRATRYELIISCRVPGAQRLVGYVAKSHSAAWRCIRANGAAIVKLTGSEDAKPQRGQNVAECGEWMIGFTGRTERDAIMAGEVTEIGGAR